MKNTFTPPYSLHDQPELEETDMEENCLLLEQDDSQRAYYLVYTNSGAIYYGAANESMELSCGWKLVSVDTETMDLVH